MASPRRRRRATDRGAHLHDRLRLGSHGVLRGEHLGQGSAAATASTGACCNARFKSQDVDGAGAKGTAKVVVLLYRFPPACRCTPQLLAEAKLKCFVCTQPSSTARPQQGFGLGLGALLQRQKWVLLAGQLTAECQPEGWPVAARAMCCAALPTLASRDSVGSQDLQNTTSYRFQSRWWAEWLGHASGN